MKTKKVLLEKTLVIGLFLLVMVVFSFAERDTRKVFEEHNTKNTVELPKKTVDYTADAILQPVDHHPSN
jgi:hypothetical protein